MFTRSKDDPKTEKKAAPPSPLPVQKDSGAPSIISTGVEIVGHITSPGEIQLDGTIEGDISCGAFSLGESGAVNGRVTAESVTIRGRVDGEICGAHVRLEKTAQVNGDVTHQTLSVEGGARVSGHLIHSETPMDKEAKTAQNKTAPSSLEAPKTEPAAQQQPKQANQGSAQSAGSRESASGRSSEAPSREDSSTGAQRKKASA